MREKTIETIGKKFIHAVMILLPLIMLCLFYAFKLNVGLETYPIPDGFGQTGTTGEGFLNFFAPLYTLFGSMGIYESGLISSFLGVFNVTFLVDGYAQYTGFMIAAGYVTYIIYVHILELILYVVLALPKYALKLLKRGLDE